MVAFIPSTKTSFNFPSGAEITCKSSEGWKVYCEVYGPEMKPKASPLLESISAIDKVILPKTNFHSYIEKSYTNVILAKETTCKVEREGKKKVLNCST